MTRPYPRGGLDLSVILITFSSSTLREFCTGVLNLAREGQKRWGRGWGLAAVLLFLRTAFEIELANQKYCVLSAGTIMTSFVRNLPRMLRDLK